MCTLLEFSNDYQPPSCILILHIIRIESFSPSLFLHLHSIDRSPTANRLKRNLIPASFFLIFLQFSIFHHLFRASSSSHHFIPTRHHLSFIHQPFHQHSPLGFFIVSSFVPPSLADSSRANHKIPSPETELLLNIMFQQDSPTFTFESIAIHPSHGLFLATEEEEDESLSQFSSLELRSHSPPLPSPTSLHSSSSSSSSTAADDYYFFPSSSPSCSDDTSPLSSGYSTPTPDSPTAKKLFFNHYEIFPPATNFHSTAAPSRRASNPISRSHPYTRPSTPPSFTPLTFPSRPTMGGGTSMQRAYSTPVLTQKQMDERSNFCSALHTAMEQSPTLMSRSRSSGAGLDGTSGGRGWASATISSSSSFASTSSSPSPYSMMSAAPAMAMSNSSTGLGVYVPFSSTSFSLPQNWGDSLPPSKAPSTPPQLTYPYNVNQRPSPPRVNRSQSYSSPSGVSSGGMVAGGNGGTRRSFKALTPIVPQLASIPGSPEGIPKNRTTRGLSF